MSYASCKQYGIALTLCFCLIFGLTATADAKPLSKQEAKQVAQSLLQRQQDILLQSDGANWDAGFIRNRSFAMPFYYKVFGPMPHDGRSMYISMHGGGGTTADVNNQQWENQKHLYQPHEGVYFVPRAPTDTWNMWHQGYMDGLLEKAIALAVIKEGVNPNKVYIMGYSAGGDGVYQLAPRLADLWAGAAMSAGHPGDAHIENLLNLPFALYVGGQDSAYNRNGLALEWLERLSELSEEFSDGFYHDAHIFGEYGHWMEGADAMSMDWLPQFERDPIPYCIIWFQDDVLREHFYWLSVNTNDARQDDLIIAAYDDETNEVYIDESTTVQKFTIGLNDAMMDLDKPVRVYRGDRLIFEGHVVRLEENIQADVGAMRDRGLLFPVKLHVDGNIVSAREVRSAKGKWGAREERQPRSFMNKSSW
ncbi:MAG: alpha/beta hydrolase [Pseudomonadota bacterium]